MGAVPMVHEEGASTTDSTWPSYSLLHYLMPFPTKHNLGFIRIYSNDSILHVILQIIKPFNMQASIFDACSKPE